MEAGTTVGDAGKEAVAARKLGGDFVAQEVTHADEEFVRARQIPLPIVILVGLLITTLVRAFVFQPFEVPSGSMENTLQVNDKIVAQRITDFRRGDVVVFADTNGWLAGRADPGPARRARRRR